MEEVYHTDPSPVEDFAEDNPAHGHDAPKESLKKNANTPPLRAQGKSSFPVSRMYKILKADKELPMVAREATFLISVATEEFIKRFAEESGVIAARENRVTVQYRDLAAVVRRVEKFMFLDEVVPLQAPSAPAKRKTKSQKGDTPGSVTILDAFVSRARSPQRPDEDIVMNDDGSMTVDSR